MASYRARLGIIAATFVFAFGYALLTAPFRGADEFNHFFRAYHVSEGGIVAHRAANGVVGADLPASLLAVAGAAAQFPALPDIKTSSAELRTALQIPLDPEVRVVANFPNTALVSPAIYLPPAVGIAVGRLASAHPLVLFYLGRLVSALVGAGLIALAASRLPLGATPVAACALIPMTLFQMGMITGDTITIALALLCVSEVLRARSVDRQLTRSTQRWLLVLACLLSQLRPPYPMMGLAVLAIPMNRFVDQRQARWFFVSFFGLLLSLFLLWNSVVPGLSSQMRPGVTTNPQQQLLSIASTPGLFLTALANEIGPRGFEHVHEMIGFFGWRNFPLPRSLIGVAVIALIISLCACDSAAIRISRPVRAFFLGLAVSGVLATAFIVYLMWNAPGSNEIAGLQGRYFLPFLPFAMIAAANGKLKRGWFVTAAIGVLIVTNLIALALLARATYF